MKNVNLNAIRIDGGTQSRVSLHEATVAEYAQLIADGVTLPPVIVFTDGSDNWLADGFHRYHAFRKAGKASIPADVRAGTCRDAKLHSAGANGEHGLRRSNDDKRRAVQMVLEDEDCAENWSDREIAKHCAVSHPFVAAIRNPVVAAKQQANRRESAAKQALEVESDSTPAAKAARGEPSKPDKKPEVKAAAPAPTAPPADDGPSADEVAAAQREAAEELEALRKIALSDDKLAASLEENKQLRAMNRVLTERNNGLMNEKAELIKRIKALQRKLEQPA